jgi:hypothetical protein
MEKCRLCHRERPDFITDPSCEKGGYCEWEDENLTHAWAAQSNSVIPEVTITQLFGSKVTPMDAHWNEGHGQAGERMTWSFPNTAIVEGLEVQPKGSSYQGFIDALRIGHCEYLHIAPFPILMWSPGMPDVMLWIPSVPFSHHFCLETRGFYGKIRPRGLILNP